MLDAMRVMSEEGVSSVAVVDEMTGGLVGAVSAVDIGKVSSNVVAQKPCASVLIVPSSTFLRSVRDSLADEVDPFNHALSVHPSDLSQSASFPFHLPFQPAF